MNIFILYVLEELLLVSAHDVILEGVVARCSTVSTSALTVANLEGPSWRKFVRNSVCWQVRIVAF